MYPVVHNVNVPIHDATTSKLFAISNTRSAWTGAGIELASSCGRAQGERGVVLMLITAATGMTLGNTALGFLAGEPFLHATRTS